MENWFLDNLEKLVPIIIAILYFLGANKAKKMEERQEEDPDPEAEARARRIQEEIRRKILERQQGSRSIPPAPPRQIPPPMPSPAQLNREIEMPLHPREPKTAREIAEVERPLRSRMAPEPASFEQAGLYEAQQAEIEEQLRKARELRKKASKLGEHSPVYGASVSRVPSLAALRAGVKSDLRSSGSIRRAIVLKEILDRPLALR